MDTRRPSQFGPMTLRDVERVTGVSYQSLRYRLLRGDFPAIQVGRYQLVSLVDVERALAARPQRPARQHIAS